VRERLAARGGGRGCRSSGSGRSGRGSGGCRGNGRRRAQPARRRLCRRRRKRRRLRGWGAREQSKNKFASEARDLADAASDVCVNAGVSLGLGVSSWRRTVLAAALIVTPAIIAFTGAGAGARARLLQSEDAVERRDRERAQARALGEEALRQRRATQRRCGDAEAVSDGNERVRGRRAEGQRERRRARPGGRARRNGTGEGARKAELSVRDAAQAIKALLKRKVRRKIGKVRLRALSRRHQRRRCRRCTRSQSRRGRRR
jgi:hypothetical protein